MNHPPIPPAAIITLRTALDDAIAVDDKTAYVLGRLLAALERDGWQITPAGELARVTAELAALREATCPRCEGCDQPMPEPNAAGDWCCTDCITKAQAYWAARPPIPF